MRALPLSLGVGLLVAPSMAFAGANVEHQTANDAFCYTTYDGAEVCMQLTAEQTVVATPSGNYVYQANGRSRVTRNGDLCTALETTSNHDTTVVTNPLGAFAQVTRSQYSSSSRYDCGVCVVWTQTCDWLCVRGECKGSGCEFSSDFCE